MVPWGLMMRPLLLDYGRDTREERPHRNVTAERSGLKSVAEAKVQLTPQIYCS